MTIPASVALNAYANAVKSAAAGSAEKSQGPKEFAGQSFGDLVGQALGGVVEAGKASETQAVSAVAQQGDVVDLVTAVSEAEATVQTVVAVRDKVITAYQEIMRMPI
ncbi:flagellar hook-basal body complex protein FliE [Tepidicaulis sp.]|uniref:flagellar hook-basal body complex protein FliE n=1 Tax=Tepidicaulis sp. TaxID=1920809 RepID=UPI003B5C6935